MKATKIRYAIPMTGYTHSVRSGNLLDVLLEMNREIEQLKKAKKWN